MADADKHEKAKDLADQALDRMTEGERKEGEKLLDQARKLDPSAVKEAAGEAQQEAEQAKRYLEQNKDT